MAKRTREDDQFENVEDTPEFYLAVEKYKASCVRKDMIIEGLNNEICCLRSAAEQGKIVKLERIIEEKDRVISDLRTVIRDVPRVVGEEVTGKKIIFLQKSLLRHYLNELVLVENQLDVLKNLSIPLRSELLDLKAKNTILEEKVVFLTKLSSVKNATVENSSVTTINENNCNLQGGIEIASGLSMGFTEQDARDLLPGEIGSIFLNEPIPEIDEFNL